jgi:hypothetical protein
VTGYMQLCWLCLRGVEVTPSWLQRESILNSGAVTPSWLQGESILNSGAVTPLRLHGESILNSGAVTPLRLQGESIVYSAPIMASGGRASCGRAHSVGVCVMSSGVA